MLVVVPMDMMLEKMSAESGRRLQVDRRGQTRCGGGGGGGGLKTSNGQRTYCRCRIDERRGRVLVGGGRGGRGAAGRWGRVIQWPSESRQAWRKAHAAEGALVALRGELVRGEEVFLMMSW